MTTNVILCYNVFSYFISDDIIVLLVSCTFFTMRLGRTHGIMMIIASLCTAVIMCLYSLHNKIIKKDNVLQFLPQSHSLPEIRLVEYDADIYDNLPNWLPHCEKIFLDLGANIGVTVKKLFEPEKYPQNPTNSYFKTEFGQQWLRTMKAHFLRNCVH